MFDVFGGLLYTSEAIDIFILVGCWIGLSLAVGLYVFTVINSFTWYRYAINLEKLRKIAALENVGKLLREHLLQNPLFTLQLWAF